MSFLRAEWRKLAIANYTVERDLLTRFIPAGTQLDSWNGNYFVSLVGFMFINTRLLGIRIPFHTNFEEVNLRFYVKRFDDDGWKRGVVFIKEIVPKAALTFVANTVYKENYHTLPMEHLWSAKNGQRTIQYRWKCNNNWNSIQMQASIEKFRIAPGSETEFITEHYWGYARVNEHKSFEYEVAHPTWEVYNVDDYVIDVDFGAVYGKEFAFLNSTIPTSVMLAEGSEITVENRKTIKTNNK